MFMDWIRWFLNLEKKTPTDGELFAPEWVVLESDYVLQADHSYAWELVIGNHRSIGKWTYQLSDDERWIDGTIVARCPLRGWKWEIDDAWIGKMEAFPGSYANKTIAESDNARRIE